MYDIGHCVLELPCCPGMSMNSVCNGYILFLSLDAQKTSWPIPLKRKTSILQKKSKSNLKK